MQQQYKKIAIDIYQGEIFHKSQCIELEDTVLKFIQTQLMLIGYRASSNNNYKIYKRNNQTVVTCLVDDITSCSDFSLPYNKLYDSSTIVFTDNKIFEKTDYTVINLPDSFFGIYSYTPLLKFSPNKLINLAINRMDPLRQVILMDFLTKTDNLYFNFNCATHKNETFDTMFDCLGPEIQNRYQSKFNEIRPQMPMRNHSMTLEQSISSAFVNAVIETYSGPNIIALSEKIFRALQTPAPWTVYSGKGTVDYLKSLKFDVLDDILDHSYNNHDFSAPIEHDGSAIAFVDATIANAEQLSQLPTNLLVDRCRHAADVNQKILKTLKNQWSDDFACWWNDVKSVVQ